MPKRTALLLDRLMVALQKAVDGTNSGNMKGYYPERSIPISGATRPNPGVSERVEIVGGGARARVNTKRAKWRQVRRKIYVAVASKRSYRLLFRPTAVSPSNSFSFSVHI